MNDSITLRITDESGAEHIYDRHAALFAIDLTSQNNRLRAKNAELRTALEQTPCSCRSLMFSEIPGSAINDGCTEGIEECARCAALQPADDRATGHGSAGDSGEQAG